MLYMHIYGPETTKNVFLYPGSTMLAYQPAFGLRLLGFKCDSPLSGWATVLCLVFLAATQG